MRNALDLSMTTAPAWTSMGAYAFDWTEPAEQKAICTPLKAPGSIFWTRTGSPRNGTVLPTERSDATTRSSRTGNLRSSSILSVAWPAAPVAPPTATLMPDAISIGPPLPSRSGPPSLSCRPSPASRTERCRPCGGPARALSAPRARPGRRPSPCGASTGAASRPTGSRRSGSRSPCRRCPVQCRAPARRAPRSRRATPTAAFPSSPRGLPPHHLKYHRKRSRSRSCRTAPAVGEALPRAGRAEVEAPRELADHHEVGPLDDRALERRCVHEHREALRRPQVRVEVELLPEGEEPTLGALLVSDVVPLGAADRAEEDRVGLPAQLERARRQWATGRVDRRAADERRLELEADPGALADCLEDADGLGRHLLPDPVAREDRDPVRGHQARSQGVRTFFMGQFPSPAARRGASPD